ncbi:MAG: hypothetical protein HYT22_00425 [Candidatus Niyogibacteria bacterium]|nr:hypothetical protein [Candidatus Niyogibacteria bacterium]
MNDKINFRVHSNIQRYLNSVLGVLLFGSLRESITKKRHAKRLRSL